MILHQAVNSSRAWALIKQIAAMTIPQGEHGEGELDPDSNDADMEAAVAELSSDQAFDEAMALYRLIRQARALL